MSLFSAEASGPDIADLSGVLCGQGQITGFARTAARLTVEVDEAWRASVLAAEFGRRGVSAELSRTEDGTPVIRTAFRRDLIALARAWLGGEGTGKVLPGRFRLTGAALRLWALASGRPACRGTCWPSTRGRRTPTNRSPRRFASSACPRSWSARRAAARRCGSPGDGGSRRWPS